ncbi:MAG: hypothetical protein GF350_03815 [Chitinivibrionales bacterium]|nr:hypothetical protein [Chitinivibrionales bacterium]
MNNHMCGYAKLSWLVLLFTAAAFSQAPLFHDDFSSGAGNWVVLSGNPDIDATGGVLSVTNSEASYAIIKHDSLLTDFTFSVTVAAVSSPYTNLGVCFCLSDAGHGYYAVVNSSQQFSVAVMQTGRLLYAAPNSHIHAVTNKITVSKYNDSISIYINDHFCATIEDTAGCSGDIALLVPGGINAEYDDATISDVPVSTPPIACFSDDFDDGDLTGWYTNIADGEATAAAGTMQIAIPSTGKGTNVWVNGGFENASVKATVSHTAGSQDSLYGITLGTISVTQLPTTGLSTVYNIMGFLINANRRYAKMTPEGQITTYPPQSDINGTADSLEIRTGDNFYHFIVNGTIIDSLAVDASFQPISAGFFAGGDLTIACDNFMAGQGSEYQCPAVPARETFTMKSATAALQDNFILYDISGRKISKISNSSYKDVCSRLSRGIYLSVNKEHSLVKPVPFDNSR